VNHRQAQTLGLFIVLAVLCGSAAAQSLENILNRMEQAQSASLAQSPYTLTRSYQFFGSDANRTTSQVLATVQFQPPDQKSYNIERSSGSGQGLKVVKKVLDHETQAARAPQAGEISRQNYDFRYVRSETRNGRLCHVLEMNPKRKERDSVHGQVWVDADTFLIQHVEGELAKSPSWWIKDVHVAADYGRLAGIWLQTSLLAVANVRILGKHSMLAQDLSCQKSGELASLQPAPIPASRAVKHRRIWAPPATILRP